ncbi:MAG: hypothetical protein C0443_07850 [Comamonadaceae bacterium]|nr:hypothetical protein [Comamonadaceae bacterium]
MDAGWDEELRRRIDEVERGAVQPVAADQAFAAARRVIGPCSDPSSNPERLIFFWRSRPSDVNQAMGANGAEAQRALAAPPTPRRRCPSRWGALQTLAGGRRVRSRAGPGRRAN